MKKEVTKPFNKDYLGLSCCEVGPFSVVFFVFLSCWRRGRGDYLTLISTNNMPGSDGDNYQAQIPLRLKHKYLLT
ncbi:MAG: hypothetical protein ACI96W_000333 [Paraglaciecola sp.]|jgi:hypothetical protein